MLNLDELFSKKKVPAPFHLEHVKEAYEKLDLNNHQKRVLIAGTNGKGSTCGYLALRLKHAGYKVGLFTSPHILNYTERFWVDGHHPTFQKVESLYDQISKNLSKPILQKLSFFEISLLIGLLHFKESKTDIEILEVGLGGRLDATNIVTPIVTAITSIGLDHTHILGNTIEEISKEKSGISRLNTPHIIGETNTKKTNLLESHSKSQQTIFYSGPTHFKSTNHQNDSFAAFLSNFIRKHFFDLKNIIPLKTTPDLNQIKSLRGREQTLEFFVDSKNNLRTQIHTNVCHNIHGLQNISQNTLEETKVIIMTIMKDKPFNEMIEFFEKRKITVLLFKNFSERSIQEVPGHQIFDSFDSLWVNSLPLIKSNKTVYAGSVMGLKHLFESKYYAGDKV